MKKVYEINEERFNKNISELESFHKKNPEYVEKETKKLVEKIRSIENLKNGGLKRDFIRNSDKYAIILLITFIASLGLLNISETIALYYFGMIFFLGGYLASVSDEIGGSGVIVLFSHGCTGLALMLVPIIIEVIKNPILSDTAGTAPFIYIGVAASFIIAGIVLTIMYNLSATLRGLKIYKVLPLALFTIAIVLTTILPKLLPFLCKLKI